MMGKLLGFLLDSLAASLFFCSLRKNGRSYLYSSLFLLLTLPIYLLGPTLRFVVISFSIRIIAYFLFVKTATGRSSLNSAFLSILFANLLTALQTTIPILRSNLGNIRNTVILGKAVYYLILLSVVVMTAYYLRLKEMEEVRFSSLLFISLISIILLYSKSFVKQTLVEADQNLYPIAIMILSVSTMAVYIRMSVISESQHQSDIMKAKQKEQINSLKAEIETAEAFKQIAHDMKNHLIVLKNNLNSDSSAHIDTIISQIDAYRSSIQTGNECMDSLLSAKMPIIQSSGIRLTVSMDLSPVSYLTEFDVISVFGNALDNAIEASLSVPTESRYITIRTSFYAGKFFISFVNGCSERTDVSTNTTKNEKNLHGIGLKSIKRTVTQYNGEVSAQYSMPGEFTLSIMLPVR